jgi:hypothetical protein
VPPAVENSCAMVSICAPIVCAEAFDAATITGIDAAPARAAADFTVRTRAFTRSLLI